MRADRVARILAFTLVALAALFVGAVVAPGMPFYVETASPFALRALASVVEIASLLTGTLLAARVVVRLGRGNPARAAWALLAAWLVAFLSAQVFLSVHQIVVRTPTPVPSAADAFFLAGYAAIIAGMLTFVRVYRRTGFAVGTASSRAIVGLAVLFALLDVALLAPVTRLPLPLAPRLLNAVFPTLDFLALLPAFVLFRTTLAFRGGNVWRIWATLLAAIALACTGDVLYAYFVAHQWNRLEPLVNLVFMSSYAAGAYGAWLQLRLLDR